MNQLGCPDEPALVVPARLNHLLEGDGKVVEPPLLVEGVQVHQAVGGGARARCQVGLASAATAAERDCVLMFFS